MAKAPKIAELRLSKIAEAAYPHWWHTAEDRERFEEIIAAARDDGLIIDCPKCEGEGCRQCDWRGIQIPGVTW